MRDGIGNVNYCMVWSRIGWILIAEGPSGICLLDFLGEEKPTEAIILQCLRREYPKIERAVARTTPVLELAATGVREYLHQGTLLPQVPLDMQKGTPFQQEVWSALLEIPFGETSAYGQIARKIGRPKAARAVGHACGRNPVPLYVPCHRVLGAGGALGGFSAGLAIKETLLSIERARSTRD